MKKLDKVTLICCDTVNYGQALHSLRQSLSQIQPARTIFFTDQEIYSASDYGIEIIKIDPIKSKEEYCRWILKELWRYIETEFVLVTQWDGYVLNADSWLDDFYEYDYIGAPWIYQHGRNIGNGGFSLRSKKLCQILGADPTIEITHPEDQSVGILYRGYLEQKHGIKFPDEDLADKFAFELKEPVYDTFGFHGFFHKPYQKTIVITRTGAFGDVIMVEPILHYYYKKGYRVVLNTLPQFFSLFTFHYFKVHHIDEIDKRHLKDAKYVNLDMAYEITPERLHLESYYKNIGIQDGEIRNPKLTLQFDPKDPQSKLFKKYCVIHLDKRPQEGRNVYGVNWFTVCQNLWAKGYQVIQVGQGDRQVVEDAIQIQNTNEFLLMRIIGGADLFIGGDSGPSNIAIAMGTPAIIFFGSVNPSYIIPDESNVIAISKHRSKEKVCSLPYCWSSQIGTEGVECVEIKGGVRYTVQPKQGAECVENTDIPPCVQFSTEDVLQAIDKMINKCK